MLFRGRLLVNSWMISTVCPLVNRSVWVPSISSYFICVARRSWRAVSFFSQQVWILSGPGTVQLFIPDTLSWMSAIVMVPGSCSGSLLWSALRPNTEHWCYVMPPSLICSSSTVQSQPWVDLFSCYYLATESILWMVCWRTSYFYSWLLLFFSCLSLQASSQSWEPLLGSLQCLKQRQFVVCPYVLGIPFFPTSCLALSID